MAPSMELQIDLAKCQSELDITIVDRIHELLNPQPLVEKPSMSGMYWSVNPTFYQVALHCYDINLLLRVPPEFNFSAILFQTHFMENLAYPVSTTTCQLICANWLFSFDEATFCSAELKFGTKRATWHCVACLYTVSLRNSQIT